ncbi:MAG: hypothetical protein SVG88_03625 [Halobacteriales archaeon]|nr:hypothetical protein [Halobacteriales archaeon]
MDIDNHQIEIDDTTVQEGTAIYDTKFDRVFWITAIDEYELTIEVVEPYDDVEPIWWSSADDPTRVADGSRIAIEKFRTLVGEGRFEIGPAGTT